MKSRRITSARSFVHVLDEWAKSAPDTTGLCAFWRTDWSGKTDRQGKAPFAK